MLVHDKGNMAEWLHSITLKSTFISCNKNKTRETWLSGQETRLGMATIKCCSGCLAESVHYSLCGHRGYVPFLVSTECIALVYLSAVE